MVNLTLHDHQAAYDQALSELHDQNIVERIWQKDYTVWSDGPEEIVNRLGWLVSVETMQAARNQISTFVDDVKADGLTNVLLLGMGGSSLAPDVFSTVFADADGLNLNVLDSTDPGAVQAYADTLDPANTIYIVATKSGSTAETLSFFKYFYNQTVSALGAEKAGDHFVAITDPGSKLVDLASKHNFRRTFINDPNIGGRYSALSFFGIVPAALVGVDLDQLFASAASATENGRAAVSDNEGAQLGAAMGELAKAGRDKITLITDPAISAYGDWVEQLIAESTGKNGVGVLPVVQEPLDAPDAYRDDRFFVYMRLDGRHDEALAALEQAGHPVARIAMSDVYDLGKLFFLWEMATVIAGQRLSIQPFDQPNVESAKVRAKEMITAYQEQGELPSQQAAFSTDNATVYGEVEASDTQQALTEFLESAPDDGYIAIHAYIQPTPEADEALHDLRVTLRDKYKLATTVGYGPRFLHSTGQLHKGDGGNGMFVQITDDPSQDVSIPDEAGSDESAMSFGTLKLAQALGDRQALLDNNRQVIRFHFKDAVSGIQSLT